MSLIALTSQTFSWTVSSAGTVTVSIVNPGAQNNDDDDSVNLALTATDSAGHALTFSATNLPPGLSIDSSSGVISGTISDNADSGSPYNVRVTATDTTPTPAVSASQSFNWTVFNPTLILAVNDSLDAGDWFANLDPQTPIPILVTLQNASPGSHNVQLSIPTGQAQLSPTSFPMENGQDETTLMTPEELSQTVGDVQVLGEVDGKQAGKANVTIYKLAVQKTIYDADTPKKMLDKTYYRIPPRIYEAASVSITPQLPANSQNYAVWWVDNADDPRNGVVLVATENGDASYGTTQKSATIYLVGSKQSYPGKGDILYLEGRLYNNGSPVPNNPGSRPGKPFTVAAIPFNWSASRKGADINDGKSVGWEVNLSWRSDSGVLVDLDNVEVKEQVDIVKDTGTFKGYNPTVSGWLPADEFSSDTITVEAFRVKSPGGLLLTNQVEIFFEHRTGAVNIPATNSGYEITDLVKKNGAGKWADFYKDISPVDPIEANGYVSSGGHTDPLAGIRGEIVPP